MLYFYGSNKRLYTSLFEASAAVSEFTNQLQNLVCKTSLLLNLLAENTKFQANLETSKQFVFL